MSFSPKHDHDHQHGAQGSAVGPPAYEAATAGRDGGAGGAGAAGAAGAVELPATTSMPTTTEQAPLGQPSPLQTPQAVYSPAPAPSHGAPEQQQQQHLHPQEQHGFYDKNHAQQPHPHPHPQTTYIAPGQPNYYGVPAAGFGGAPPAGGVYPLYSLNRIAVPVECPMCGARELTRTEFKAGGTADAAAVVLCLLACLCCIPYIATWFKDVEHRCGKCHALLAVWKRSGRTEIMIRNADGTPMVGR